MFESAGTPGQILDALCALEHPTVDANTLLAAAVAQERLISLLQAHQARTLAAFADTLPPELNGAITSTELAAAELGPALTLSPSAAAHRVALAQRLTDRLPATLTALETGAIDLPRARAIADGTTNLTDRLATTVEAQVLPLAPTRTVGAVRAAIARAILTADPQGAAARHRVAHDMRRVAFTPEPDGMASIWALLSAPAARAIYDRITDLATKAQAPTDDRDLDARRADTFTDLLLGTCPIPQGRPGQRASRGTTTTSAKPASQGRPTGTCTATAAATTPAPAAAAEQQDEPDTPEVDDGLHDAWGQPGWDAGIPARVHITLAATTLLGLDDDPAHLAGYGPLSATLARHLAANPSSTWRRLLTDPATGALLDYGRRTYRPPAALKDHVRARDQHCRFPGCPNLARRADLDHTTAYPTGPTSQHNLAVLCRRHHRLKHRTKWTVVQHDNGHLTWTSPTGRRYETEPEPLPGPIPRPAPPPPPDAGPPPF